MKNNYEDQFLEEIGRNRKKGKKTGTETGGCLHKFKKKC